MLTRMTEEEWATVLELFRACRSRRGAKGRNDRIFLEALHYFAVHNITWRALPEAFGNWNSVWKRFWRSARRACSKPSSTPSLQPAAPRTWFRCSTPPSCGRMSRPQGPKGAAESGPGPLPRGLLDQDPPQG